MTSGVLVIDRAISANRSDSRVSPRCARVVLMHVMISSLLLPPPSESCSLRVSWLFLRGAGRGGGVQDAPARCTRPPQHSTAHPAGLHARQATSESRAGRAPVRVHALAAVDLLNDGLEVAERLVDDARFALLLPLCAALLDVLAASEVHNMQLAAR